MIEEKSCHNCGNRCVDTNLDPYCGAQYVTSRKGLTLKRGPIEGCLVSGELTLWERDLRSQR